MKCTKKNQADIAKKATRWLQVIPKSALSKNDILIYKREDLRGFLADYHSAPVDWEVVYNQCNPNEIQIYYYLLIGMAEALFELNATLAYNPETWKCEVLNA